MCRLAAAQWHDATRKNYYVKYSARMMLGMHFFVNATMAARVIQFNSDLLATDATDTSPGSAYYSQQVQSSMVSDAAAHLEARRTHGHTQPPL